jgi:cytoskeleton protein RodZ
MPYFRKAHLMNSALHEISALGDPDPEVITQMPVNFSDLSIGEKLSHTRLQREWTIQYVAEQLKLSQSQIVALEQNQYRTLPKMVIVRGFVRAYAKLLKLDADLLVAMLPKDGDPIALDKSLRPALSTPFIDSRMSLLGQHDTNRKYIIGAISLVILVALFLLFQRFDLANTVINFFGKESTKVSPPPSLTPAPLAASKESGPDSNATAPTSNSELAIKAQEVAVQPSPSNQINDGNDKSLANVQSNTEPVVQGRRNDGAVAALSTTGSNNGIDALSNNGRLVFKFKQASWVQVKNEKGVILSSHIAKAGTEESFELKDPLRVTLGNVAGVEAVLRGEIFPLVPEKGSNVLNLLVK